MADERGMRDPILPGDPDDVWMDTPSRWRPMTRDGERTATVSCPHCGGTASLSDHTIEDDGTVHPSLVCPYDDCDYHEWVTLVDWSHEIRKEDG